MQRPVVVLFIVAIIAGGVLNEWVSPNTNKLATSGCCAIPRLPRTQPLLPSTARSMMVGRFFLVVVMMMN